MLSFVGIILCPPHNTPKPCFISSIHVEQFMQMAPLAFFYSGWDGGGAGGRGAGWGVFLFLSVHYTRRAFSGQTHQSVDYYMEY